MAWTAVACLVTTTHGPSHLAVPKTPVHPVEGAVHLVLNAVIKLVKTCEVPAREVLHAPLQV